MTTENTPALTPDTTEAPAATSAPATAPPVTPAPAPTASAAPSEDWKDVRIRQQAARIAKLEKAGTASPEPTPAPAGTGVQDDFNRRVAAASAAQVAQIEFDRKCNDIAEAGRKLFPETFDKNVAALLKLVESTDATAVRNYTNFVEVAIDTGKGAELLNRLGGDLNEAIRLLALSPARQAIELTKLSLAEGAVAPPSAAPPPIKPIGDGGRTAEPIDPRDTVRADKLSTREWMERREAQIAEARKRA